MGRLKGSESEVVAYLLDGSEGGILKHWRFETCAIGSVSPGNEAGAGMLS